MYILCTIYTHFSVYWLCIFWQLWTSTSTGIYCWVLAHEHLFTMKAKLEGKLRRVHWSQPLGHSRDSCGPVLQKTFDRLNKQTLWNANFENDRLKHNVLCGRTWGVIFSWLESGQCQSFQGSRDTSLSWHFTKADFFHVGNGGRFFTKESSLQWTLSTFYLYERIHHFSELYI